MCASTSHERGGRAIEPKIRRHIVCEAERLKIFFKRTCELSIKCMILQSAVLAPGREWERLDNRSMS